MSAVETLSLLVALASAGAAWVSAAGSKRSATAAERAAGSAERTVALSERAEEERVVAGIVRQVEKGVRIPEVRMALDALSEPHRSRKAEILAQAIVKASRVAEWLEHPAVKEHFPEAARLLRRVSAGEPVE